MPYKIIGNVESGRINFVTWKIKENIMRSKRREKSDIENIERKFR